MKNLPYVFTFLACCIVNLACSSITDGRETPFKSPVGQQETLLWNPEALHTRRQIEVSSVYDGDTFKTIQGESIRMLGIDAPELASKWKERAEHQKGALKAKDRLRELIGGKTVDLVVPDEVPMDKYSRTLALVFLAGDSVPVNARLLQEGLVRVLIIDDGEILNVEEWRQLERAAL
ncbi:MAG: thermonuclease family protein [Candidatus Lindowbacteria bacterium]|nr:thermonuclease family protein [Candidatus Lindowbacteria bacterium]